MGQASLYACGFHDAVITGGGEARMDERWCYETLRRYRWRDGVACVRCGSRHVTVHTRPHSGPKLKYLCLECRRIFTDLTGTVFSRSNLPLSRWFLGLALLSQGLSTREYAREVSVKWDTARRMSRSLIVAVSEVGLVSELRALLDGRAGTLEQGDQLGPRR